MLGDAERLCLGREYAELMSAAEATPLPDDEAWTELVERISVPGRVNEITEETFWYFLEVLPPKLFGGNRFCFAEGDEPLRLFWQREGRYFCRQLTRHETQRLCDLTGLPRDYGYR
jgi:hypothetical protein